MANNEPNIEDQLQHIPRPDVDPSLHGLPTLTRWYIDSRKWESQGQDLPLLETLRPSEQEAVKRYYHAADRRMSLASHLLKYLYIHHACGVPWKDIVFSRTAPPEHRPYYDSPSSTKVEFNVSHQASMTILAGTIAPDAKQLEKLAAAGISPLSPRLGIDITCVNERKPIKTYRELEEYVNIFSEVFSPSELEDMKNPQRAFDRAVNFSFAKSFASPREDNVLSDDELVRYGLRLFYSYWALKEAYVKLTGEALLADWLRDLEFTNVVPPDPVIPALDSNSGIATVSESVSPSVTKWGAPYTGVIASKNGQRLKDVRLELIAFDSDYIIATAGYGSSVGAISNVVRTDARFRLQITQESTRCSLNAKKVVGEMNPRYALYPIADPWLPVQEVDVELDIRECAEGRCLHRTGPSGLRIGLA